MTQPLSIDVFWSFRSPWSYLATPRLRQWQQDYELKVNLRPVYPIAIRTPEFFQQVNPMWFNYFMTDVFRVADYLELPFVWPNPDPVVQVIDERGQRRTHPEQPYIHRLTRLGVAAAERGRALEFADEVSRLIWGGTADWYHGDHLAIATAKAGLDLADLDTVITQHEARMEATIAENQQAHERAGHWGVPTFAFNGEPFFGQDRMDVLLWRLEQSGLTRRS